MNSSIKLLKKNTYSTTYKAQNIILKLSSLLKTGVHLGTTLQENYPPIIMWINLIENLPISYIVLLVYIIITLICYILLFFYIHKVYIKRIKTLMLYKTKKKIFYFLNSKNIFIVLILLLVFLIFFGNSYLIIFHIYYPFIHRFIVSFIFTIILIGFTLFIKDFYNFLCVVLFALLLSILENNDVFTFVIILLMIFFYINIKTTFIYKKIIKNKNFNNFLELISYVFLLLLLFKRGSLIYEIFMMEPALTKVAKALIVAVTTREIFNTGLDYLTDKSIRENKHQDDLHRREEESKTSEHNRAEDSKNNHHRRVEESLDSENKRKVVPVVKEINESQPKAEKKGWNIRDSFNFTFNDPKKK